MNSSPTQHEIWNGPSGHAWVDLQHLLDKAFAPFEALLAGYAAARPEARLLDVGCGTGATTLAAARALGPKGSATGVDISDPMLALARRRAVKENLPVTFLLADAQSHVFPPGSFDLLISRFGIMFFDDPVQAFSRLRASCSENAECHLIAWRSPADNPFMTAAERAAAPLLPELPARRPNAPGQFAFADAERTRSIFQASGWAGPRVTPLDVECAFPASELDTFLSRIGPVGQALASANATVAARVMDAVRPAFDEYTVGAEIRFTAACWLIEAKA